MGPRTLEITHIHHERRKKNEEEEGKKTKQTY